MGNNPETIELEFKARSHIFKLLGDELIGNDRLAVFELVKNAYDADATSVAIELGLKSERPQITIIDNGSGMSLDDIKRGWLEIGSSYKRGKNRVKTNRERTPLGEKGVGRLAAHKLGSTLEIITKKENSDELHIAIHWPTLISDEKYLEDSKIKVERKIRPTLFREGSTGTFLKISDLHKPTWERGDVRSLHRLLTGLISPFEKPDKFDIQLSAPDMEDWLKDMFSTEDILSIAPWKFSFKIKEDGSFTWKYEFSPPKKLRTVKSRTLTSNDSVDLERLELRNEDRSKPRDQKLLTSRDLEGIGRISGTFHVYFRRKEVLDIPGHSREIRAYLDTHTGVRIYRDGVRVYNYGEPEDDWLGLNADRINSPADKMGTNSVIGVIDLSLEGSQKLNEKTNREGFDENETYLRFRNIVRSVVNRLDNLRNKDRRALEAAIRSDVKEANPKKFESAIEKIRAAVSRNHAIEKAISPQLDYVEREYKRLAEIATSTGLAGMNLPLIFHEIEREITRLDVAVKNGDDLSSLSSRIRHIAQLLEGFTPLVKRSGVQTTSIRKLVQRLSDINEGRLKAHQIIFSAPVLSEEDQDFQIHGLLNLYLSAMNNLLDNSIHWVSKHAEAKGANYTRAIQIRTLTDWAGEGPCLAFLDSGPGFTIDTDDAIRPFVSDRAGGMGLGLYFSRLVMELQGGNLIITHPKELEISTPLSGAAVLLRFRKVSEK